MGASSLPRVTAGAPRGKAWAKFVAAIVLSVVVLGVFSMPLGPLPPLGSLLDPTTGLWSVPFQARLPASATVRVPGLQAPVTVLRDTTGVPHIYAENAEDGFFALGYVHAQDRLWQMDIQYRAAAGRLSEVLGPDYVATDEFFRTIGLNRIATEASMRRANANGLDESVMQAYAAGVNAYISSLSPPAYPIEFKLLGYKPEAWTTEKSLAEGGLIAWSLMGDFHDLEYNLLVEKFGAVRAQELFPDYPAGIQYPIQPALANSEIPLVSGEAARDILRKAAAASEWLPRFEGMGSNNWAILGNRTASGKPLLAADPHLQYQLPAVWYWAELQAAPYHLRGATFPGIPAFFFGTNGAISWGETNTGADVNDFFLETLNPEKTQYLYRGQWYDVIVYDEPIRVKGGSVVDFKVNATRHGPILTELGQTVAMESTIQHFGDELAAMLGIAVSQDAWHFNESSRLWHVPAQNIIYADANSSSPYGNVGVRSTGLYPIRGNFSGRLPVNGSSGEQEWIGWVPFEAMPHAFNPPQGFVTSTNQVPAPPAYEYASSLGSLFDPGYRARRIHALLAANDQATVDDMKSYQTDVHDVAAESVVPYVLTAVGTTQGTVAAEARQALASWQGAPSYEMTVDAVGATIWYAFTGAYMDGTFGDEYRQLDAADLPYPQFNTLEDLTVDDLASSWFDNVSTPVITESRDDILREAFDATVSRLTAQLGSDVSAWTWGRIHSKAFDQLSGLDALSRGPIPAPGDGFTLNPAGGLVAHGGSSWRQVVDFADLDTSWAIYPGGQSGNPLSPHYDDFLEIYMAGEYLPFGGYPTPESLGGVPIESNLQLLPG
ncbi:MAG TPA: penicillin acylase family protein [Thermoplasmata archaeon]